MLRRLAVPALLFTALTLSACAESAPTAAQTTDDYALVMFGDAGTALEGTLGTMPGSGPFDGRSGHRPLPDSLRLTDEQRTEIAALREAFRVAHADELAALRAIFERARDARRSGATRAEVRAILEEGRPIAEALRPDVVALHAAVRAVLTEAQRAWLDAHRPWRPRRP